jgi:hypothetical protein
MPKNPALQNKIDQLQHWLNANTNAPSADDKDRAFDALVSLQKERLADLLLAAPSLDVTAAIKTIDGAIDGINAEAKTLATVAQVIESIALAATLIEKALASGA